MAQKATEIKKSPVKKTTASSAKKTTASAAKKTTASPAKKETSSKVNYRIESDLLGERKVPQSALYGVQTVRAIDNFKISGHIMNRYPNFVKGIAYTKLGAAIANYKEGLLTKAQKDAIVKACQEIVDGKLHEYFVTDMIQGGAGTSVNMNANEVIANRALELMGKERGQYEFCSPNDHVNCSQSTNDAYPTAVHLALYFNNLDLIAALDPLIKAFDNKAKEFEHIVKMGRTQLQDAVPMTLGQSFQAFADGLRKEAKLLSKTAKEFLICNMGATAIGTGICSQPGYSGLFISAIREATNLDIKLDDNLVLATSDTSSMVSYSSGLKRLCIKLNKICNDLRLMSSGPRCGLNEINLPPMQPGSSIMPGKVNPVIPEVVNQICFKVIGNDLCVTLGAEAAQLELNVMEPVMSYSIFESVELLKRGFDTLRRLCIEGITANEDVCKQMVRNSIGIVTALNPYIGYKNSSMIAKEALASGRGVYELIIEKNILTKVQLDKILSPENMIKPIKLTI
ncbi:MAG: aspartate ammonia-lyase [Bacteroidales bacterium]